MAIARSRIVDSSVARWYHCISRCVRRAFLLGDGEHDRKGWIESRLQELSQIFAIAVGGFSVMDNHLHVLLRLDPNVAIGLVRRRGRATMGTALSRSRQIRAGAAADGRVGSMAAGGPTMGGDGSRAVAKPQLVHEVPERTAVASGQSSR